VRDEITALLITYRSRAAAFTLPRFVNARTALQAASPRLEMARLTELVGLGRNSFLAIGGLLIFIAMAAIFVSQLNNMRERAYDLALFRILGASPGRLMGLMTLESVLLSSLGATLGVLLGHAVLFGAGLYVRDGLLSGITGIAVLPAIYIIWAVVVFSSFVSGLLVAWNAYRKELQENLVRQK
jgi:putative ABC transport system permease protein